MSKFYPSNWWNNNWSVKITKPKRQSGAITNDDFNKAGNNRQNYTKELEE